MSKNVHPCQNNETYFIDLLCRFEYTSYHDHESKPYSGLILDTFYVVKSMSLTSKWSFFDGILIKLLKDVKMVICNADIVSNLLNFEN